LKDIEPKKLVAATQLLESCRRCWKAEEDKLQPQRQGKPPGSLCLCFYSERVSVNRGLIHCLISGFGRTGPYADKGTST
jgi:hypothetical protein